MSETDAGASRNIEREPRLPMLVVRREGAVAAAPGRLSQVLRTIRWIPLVMMLVMTGGFIGLYFQPPGLQFLMRTLNLQPGGGTNHPIATPVTRAPPLPTTPRIVVGLGRLLPEGDVITVAPPFGAGDARVARLTVAEGERVTAGQVLAVLDSERQYLAALESSRANVASREASLAQVRAAVAASREEARASLARSEATFLNASREYERIEQLRRSGYGSEQSFDLRRTQRDEAQREVDRARATLSRYAGEGGAQPDIVVAARALDAAKADQERAAADLEKAYARAPVAATVLTIHAQPGERPGTKGVMTIGAIDRMKVEVEVYQAQIGLVAVGAPAEVMAEALGAPLKGIVRQVGLEVARQTIVDAGPAASTDARVVKVTVALDPDSSVRAGRFSNLQVTARISTAPSS